MIIKNLTIYFLKVKKINNKKPLPSFFNNGFIFIKLFDENGYYGFGEPSPYICETKELILHLKNIYNKNLKNKKISEINIEKLKKNLKNKIKQKIIVCFDHALKEIIAHNERKNVAQLISNKEKIFKKIPLYASGGMIFENIDYESLIDEALEHKEKGFIGWKFRPSFPKKNLSHAQRIKHPPPFNLKKIIKFSTLLRKKVGEDFKLMLDCGSRCRDVNEAIYLTNALKELNFFFVEEPLPRKLELYRNFIKKKKKLKIASGEDISSLKDFENWQKHKVEILQPDTNLLTFNELNNIENKYKKKIVFHNWCNPINFAINVNYVMSTDKKILLEKNILKNPYEFLFQNNSFKINNGMIVGLKNLGYGVTFNMIKNKDISLNEIKI